MTICWLTDPDHTQHRYGLGAPQSLAALRGCDAVFSRLLASLDTLGWRDHTNVIVTSDHGFTTRRPQYETDPIAALASDDVIVSGGAIYLTERVPPTEQGPSSRPCKTTRRSVPSLLLMMVRRPGSPVRCPFRWRGVVTCTIAVLTYSAHRCGGTIRTSMVCLATLPVRPERVMARPRRVTCVIPSSWPVRMYVAGRRALSRPG